MAPILLLLLVACLMGSSTRAEAQSSPPDEIFPEADAHSPISTPTSSSPFLIEPKAEPIYVREHETGVVIECRFAEPYRNQSRYNAYWMKILNSGGSPQQGPKFVAHNSNIYMPHLYELDANSGSGRYNLRIKSVSRTEDNGKFFCTIFDQKSGEQLTSRPADVVVLVPPGPPLISTQPSAPVHELDLVTFRCDSFGGNPPPTFVWVFGNDTLVPESLHHERITTVNVTGEQLSQSTIQWHVKSEDNNGYLSCRVSNVALNATPDEFLSAQSNLLNVLYAPRVSITPHDEVNVEEGSAVELDCNADGNPSVERIQWSNAATGQTYPNVNWTFTAERRQTGEIRCLASNSIGTAEARLQMRVLYGPKVRILTNSDGGEGLEEVGGILHPKEGDHLTLECVVDAMPTADRVEWTGPGNFAPQTGTRLLINSISSRLHLGNFTCSAANSLPLSQPHGDVLAPPVTRIGTASVFVDVQRPPGGTTTISARKMRVDVGEPIALICSVEGDQGSPPPKFRWEIVRGGDSTAVADTPDPSTTSFPDILNSRRLTIPAATLQHYAEYRCHPYNSIGGGEVAGVRVEVVQPAKITRPLAPITFPAGALDKALLCTAEGFPAPSIQWKKDNHLITAGMSKHWRINEQSKVVDGCGMGEVCPFSVASTLTFAERVEWNDKGNWSCHSQNGATTDSGDSWSSATLHVTHDPIILNRRFQPDAMAFVAGEIGEDVSLKCLVSVRPSNSISFEWTHNGVSIGRGLRALNYRTTSAALHDRLDEVESTLELSQLQESDYGLYECKASTGHGGSQRAELSIRLQPKGLPQTPKQVRLLESSTTWLQVGWQAGFDGGAGGGGGVSYEVEYKAVDPYTGEVEGGEEVDGDNVFILIEGKEGNATSRIYYHNLPDGSRQWSLSPSTYRILSTDGEEYLLHRITRLRPSMTVKYRVRARNSMGPSRWTPLVSATTKDVLIANGSVSGGLVLSAPDSLHYNTYERKLTVQLRGSNAQSSAPSTTCILLYVMMGGGGGEGSGEGETAQQRWRSVDCFPLMSDGSIQQVEPAERFRARQCLRRDLSTCSAAIEILSEHSSPNLWQSWRIAAVIIMLVVVLTSLLFFMALICSRRRKTASAAATLLKRRKKLTQRLQESGGVVVDRIEIDGSDPKSTTAPNGSQSDSGVFTLGSVAATNALHTHGTYPRAPHPHHHHHPHSLIHPQQILLDGAGPGSWQGSSTALGGGGCDIETAYDFTNDPYLMQEYGGGGGGGGEGQHPGMQFVYMQQHRLSALPHPHGNTAPDEEEEIVVVVGGSGAGSGNSNEHLIVTTDSSDTASVYNNGAGKQCRVMREIIV